MDEEINVKGTNNEKVPCGRDKELRNRIKEYAEEHNFIVSDFVEKKIKWSQCHGGRCFCSPFERVKCPCDNVYEDMKKYNGRCLCRLFWKPDAYDKWMKQKQKQKTFSDVKEKSSLKKDKSDEEKRKEKEIVQNVWKNLH